MAVDPRNFHHYEILTREDGSLWELGRGAMGVTYKARDTRLDRLVALKVISPACLNSEVARERFRREARNAANLLHRNVASVFYFPEKDEADYFYAMEFVEGETIDALVKRQGPLELRLALKIAHQVAKALTAAEKSGLVHRDIKPSNLMLAREDEEFVVKLIDFGLAKGVVATDDLNLTADGLVCTPLYASPEQLNKQLVDTRSDIYSLGVTLWFVLTGHEPFGGTLAQVIAKQLQEPPPLGELKALPPQVVSLLARMLEKSPAERPQTAAELKQELQRILAETQNQHAPSGTGAAGNVPEHDKGSTGEIAAAEIAPRLPAAGMVIAGRYELIRQIAAEPEGEVFEAEDRSSRKRVEVRFLKSALLGTPQNAALLVRDVAQAQRHPHPHLRGLFDFQRTREGGFLVEEAVNGFSLLDLLRSRRALPLSEVLLLLDPLAQVVDHACEHGLDHLDLRLGRVTIHFAGILPSAHAHAELLTKSLIQWRSFSVKVFPRRFALAFDQAATATEATLADVPMRTDSASPHELGRQYLRDIGMLTYELLGGAVGPPRTDSASARFVPLAALSEEGNAVLKRSLRALPPTFVSATDFRDALARTELPGTGRDPARERLHGSPAAPPTRQKPRRSVWLAVLAVLIIGGGGYALRQDFSPPAGAPTTPPPQTPRPTPPSTPATTPSFTPPPRPTPTPPPTTPAPPPPASTPAPTTDVEVLYVKAVRLLQDGSAENEVSAFQILKNMESRNYPPALNQLGLCYAEGRGVEQNGGKAFDLFARADQLGDRDGTGNLGVMYMNGGATVTQNSERAVELFQRGAATNALCMYSLARCLWEGVGIREDRVEAERLFRKAAERGHEGAAQWLKDHGF